MSDEKKNIPRRSILQGGALVLASLGVSPAFLSRVAMAASAPGARRKTLVCLFQRGAVDGLSMLVPHGESAYYADRPKIAIPRPGAADGAIDLDGRFGLHPKLASLKALWDAKELAFIPAAGSPDATRSHFDAQRWMEVGEIGARAASSGWLTRCLDCARGHGAASIYDGVAMTPVSPLALAGGAEPALVISDLKQFGIRSFDEGERATTALRALWESAGDAADPVAQAGREAFDAMAKLATVRADPPAGWPKGPLARRLAQASAILQADLGTRVLFVDCGGWDTHTAQNGRLPPLLAELGDSLAAFRRDLGDRMEDVMVLTMSEFGRMVAENGTGGTDHGHGTVMMAFGGGVKGGRILGRWPGLAREQRFESRDLAVTTDFRDLFAEAAGGHLGIETKALFPGFTPSKPAGLFG